MTEEAVTRRTIIDMFIDRTPGESYRSNRMATQEGDNGNVELIAYTWLKIAEYNESRNIVTVFTGHVNLRSKTVTRYLNHVISRANERGRSVVISGESPVVDKPNAGTDYIGNYVSMDGNQSEVEKDAVREVEQSLAA